MKELLKFLKPYTKESILGPLFKLTEATFELFVPLVIAGIVSNVIERNDNAYILKMGGLLVLLALIGLTCALTAQFFAAKAASNKMKRWIFRFIGFFLMYIGMSMVFKPLSVLADVIPFLGTIVGKGTSFVAFIIAAIFSLITIAIAWIAYRPIISISLLVIAGICIFLFISKKKAATAQ